MDSDKNYFGGGEGGFLKSKVKLKENRKNLIIGSW